jgi:tetratricopeptide (TPR) repeat protein
MKQISCVMICIACFCTSCASYIGEQYKYLDPYHCGDLQLASCKIQSTLNQAIPGRDYRKSPDATWLLLDSATLHFSKGNIKKAIEDYNLAIEAIDYYNQDLILESVGKVLLQDELGAYPGEDYEQILARIYFSLALLHHGDEGNACALLRQAEELQQKKRNLYKNSSITQNYKLVDNPLGKYLFALLLEKRRDFSNAQILYRQAEDLINADSNCTDLSSVEFQVKEQNQATVLVLCHNGNVPTKISEISPPSIASTLALEIFLGDHSCSSPLSSISGIPTPTLVTRPGSLSLPTFATVDFIQKPLRLCYNVAKTAFEQLEQKKPIIVARGIARYILRREAVRYASHEDEGLGAFVDLAMLIANLNTRADTRSWTTLPETINLARYDVTEGPHHVTIQVLASDGSWRSYDYDLHLISGDLCVINIFNIHPDVTTILVPDRFLDSK